MLIELAPMKDNRLTSIKNNWFKIALALFVVGIVYCAVIVNVQFWSIDTMGSDTYYAWVEGRRILEFKNPYSRILDGNMEENNKYATYFPLFYEAGAVVQYVGLQSYKDWISFWRYIFLITNILTGLILFITIYSKQTWVLAISGMLFWYFNRWTLFASSMPAIDMIPIFLLVLSLVIFEKYRKTSLLFYSFSLAIKQIAIFLAPLFLIWEYQRTGSIKKTILAGLWIISIPLVSSLPFLYWDAEGFIKSVGFSATRDALSHFGANSIDTVFNWGGLFARLPFLGMLCLAYFAAWKNTLAQYGAAMFVMAIFVAFNTVLFQHYPLWLMCLIPLALNEWNLLNQNKQATSISNV